VTIHPFDDGNGRIARAIADMSLARSEGSSQRFYSMSAQIREERADYFRTLEQTQRGTMDVTPWMEWFLGCMGRAIDGARETLGAVLDKLREAGAKIERKGSTLTVRRNGELRPVDITTMPYSGFPTDAQAQMMVLMTLTPGLSIITERIFESRFMHVSELARLGAEISIEGPSAIVKGGTKLSGAPVMASDLRASAALVIAGLAARGSTQVNRIYHLDRGYEKIDDKLRGLGARVKRVQET
jgi:hypothetical protein